MQALGGHNHYPCESLIHWCSRASYGDLLWQEWSKQNEEIGVQHCSTQQYSTYCSLSTCTRFWGLKNLWLAMSNECPWNCLESGRPAVGNVECPARNALHKPALSHPFTHHHHHRRRHRRSARREGMRDTRMTNGNNNERMHQSKSGEMSTLPPNNVACQQNGPYFCL